MAGFYVFGIKLFSPGSGVLTIEMARENPGTILKSVKRDLQSERYIRGEVRRVFIPKPGGKQRGPGIPNVIDRVVQEAVRQVLEPIFEPRFQGSSHGFRIKLIAGKGKVEVLLSEKTKRRINAKIVELTPGNWGNSLRYCIKRLNKYLKGWIGFFGKCTAQVETVLGSLDAHIRRRLRAILFKHWKRKRTMIRKLTSYGARHKTAVKSVCQGRKSIWVLSINSASHSALRNMKFEEWGLVSLKESRKAKYEPEVTLVAPVQLLPLG